MKDYSLISVKLVMDVIERKGFYYVKTEKLYGEDYIGPKYIVATDDKNFESNHPEFEEMIIVPVSKFIELVEVINDYACNEMREKKRWERHHNEEGYYEEIPETDDDRLAPLAIKDLPQDPVEDEIERLADKERLLNAMNALKELQRKRVYAYFFEDKTQLEIATEEGVKLFAVQKSINSAIKKLKKIL